MAKETQPTTKPKEKPTQQPLIPPQELWKGNGGVMAGIDNAASTAGGADGKGKKKN